MTVTKTGLKQAFVLVFLHVGSRRVICSPATFKPDKRWMVNQVVSMLTQAQEANLSASYLIRDNDNCYVREFEAVFEQADMRVMATAPRAPNQTAFCAVEQLFSPDQKSFSP